MSLKLKTINFNQIMNFDKIFASIEYLREYKKQIIYIQKLFQIFV